MTMTIDEAIQRENKIAEENQKIVDTEIVFDDVSLSQLYCDDTEVIEEHLSNYRKCSEYHKQLAEWLEELKELRAYKEKMEMQYIDDIDNPLEPLKLQSALQSEIFKFNYRKEHKPQDINILDYTVMYALKHCLEEQLKAGEENDKSI